MNAPPDPSGRTNWRVILLVLAATVIALLPLILQLRLPDHAAGHRLRFIVAIAPTLLAAFACYWLGGSESREERRDVILLCVLLTFLITHLHVWLVDSSTYPGWINRDWQLFVHKSVMKLDATVLPHSYRFLPNSYVALLQLITGDYASARDSYRNLFDFLLLFALYRLARFYVSQLASVLCLVLFVAVLPVSFRYYAGQLTDPMSHLSFVLAFIFIASGQFPYLLMTIAIGALAKETILAMAGYYALLHCRARSYWTKIIALLATAAGVYLGVRALVLHGVPAYNQISGVSWSHPLENWREKTWRPALLFTVGIYLPFVVLAWRRTPAGLKSLSIYLFVVFFVSSLCFSWLRETRNFIPLVAVFAIIAAQHLAHAQPPHRC